MTRRRPSLWTLLLAFSLLGVFVHVGCGVQPGIVVLEAHCGGQVIVLPTTNYGWNQISGRRCLEIWFEYEPVLLRCDCTDAREAK